VNICYIINYVGIYVTTIMRTEFRSYKKSGLRLATG